MIRTYKVAGMTCNGCRAHVEEQLKQIKNVVDVSVNLDKGEAYIDMAHHISTQVLQDALPKKYVISSEENNDITVVQRNEKGALKLLYPLFLIFLFITGASVLLHYKTWNVTHFMLDFMGLFYVVFSFFKLLDIKGFSESFKMYDPLAGVVPSYGWVYPFIELTLGLMFLMRFQIPVALIVTLIILGITTFGVAKTLLNNKEIQCACLGTVLKLPMTHATLIENTIMIIMAIIMLIK